MVQSLKENKTLKNALDAMKNTPITVAVRMVDTGIGLRLPYIESSTVGEVAGNFSKASTAAKDDAYQLAKGTGNIGKGASGANEFDDILIDSYKNLRKNKEISGQAHHLNQDAAFRDYIPTNDGLSVKLEGNIFKDIDSPHYNAHKSLEDFWNIYRKNGDLAGLKPNLTDYNNALRDSLINAGLSEAQVNKAVSEAIKQQINAGLLADDFVPRIPGRINLPKPKP